METASEKVVAALLREAATAHGVYETNVLGGVFDEEWPAWYAAYLLDHGLGDLLPGAESLDVDNLTAMLARLAADYERGEQASPWPDVYARGIVASFRGTLTAKNLLPRVPQKFKLFRATCATCANVGCWSMAPRPSADFRERLVTWNSGARPFASSHPAT